MKCLILAGGFATRLYPLTRTRAKALLEFRGKPVITHVVNKIPRTVDIMVTVNKQFEADFLRWRDTLDRPVEILVEEAVSDEQKKGAIRAVDFWIKNKSITDDLIIVAADNYFELDVADLIEKFDEKNAIVAVYDVGDKEKACELGRVCQVGLVIVENDRIVRLDEKPPEPTSSIVATGIYVLPSRLFPVLSRYCTGSKRDNLGSFITHLLDYEEVHAYTFTETWIDIGDEILRGRLTV